MATTSTTEKIPQKNWFYYKEPYLFALAACSITGLLAIGEYNTYEMSFSVALLIALLPLLLLLFVIFFLLTSLYFMKLAEEADFKDMKDNDISFTCSSCSVTHPLPLHARCPKCEQVNRLPLYPNEYGIHHHTCMTCSNDLPTHFYTRKAMKMELCCPHCDETMPDTLTCDKHIVIVGNPHSGKTTLSLKMLRQFTRTGLAKIMEDEQDDTFKRILWDEERGALPRSIFEEMDNEGFQLLYHPKDKKYPFQVHFFDINYKDNAGASHPFFKNAHTILFLMDPYSIPSFREKNGVPKDIKYSAETPLESLRKLSLSLDKYRTKEEQKEILLNIVLTKTDTGYLDGILSKNNSQEIRNTTLEHFIQKDLEQDAFMHHLKMHFGTVNYHAISALDADGLTPFISSVCGDIGVSI